mmetsp:Transcript_13910/g.35390  ORF Transcript_13910/g.35390 Transcript_13910/m.35390 type:complete len:394 (+) Transcript_13910:17-1198(+)
MLPLPLLLGAASARTFAVPRVAWASGVSVCSEPQRANLSARSPDAARLIAEACAPYPTGRWCANSSRCADPPNSLLVNAHGLPLEPLHAEGEDGAIARCLRARSRSTSGERLLVAFVGDSQTRMLAAAMLQWLKRGRNPPAWTSTTRGNALGKMTADAAAAGWSLDLLQLNVCGLYRGSAYGGRARRPGSNVTSTLEEFREALRRLNPTRVLTVFGLGIWDLAFESYTESDHLSKFPARYQELLFGVHALLTSRRDTESLLLVRNQFVSYAYFRPRRRNRLIGGMHALNVIVEAAIVKLAHEESRRLQAEPGVNGSAAGGALRGCVRTRLLDTWALSLSRSSEMPFGKDGLHWYCKDGPRHMEQVNSLTRRPFEVALGALQLALATFCGLDGG